LNQIADLKVAIAGRLKGIRTTIDAKLKKLADDIIAINGKTKRAGGLVNFAAAGSQPFDLVWSTPFPDDTYGVWVTLISATPAQVHWTYALVNKTAAKVTINVVAASAVGDVVIDGLAVRTT